MSKLIPENFYRGRAIKDQVEWATAETGTDFVQIPFRILDGEFKDRIVIWKGFFGDASAQRSLDSLKYCGCTFPENDIQSTEGIDANEVSLEVEHDTYENDQGKQVTVAKVAWVNSAVRGVKPEQLMSDGAKAAFKAKFMGMVAQSKLGSGGAGGTAGGDQPKPKVPF
jgi:hypothetical protein